MKLTEKFNKRKSEPDKKKHIRKGINKKALKNGSYSVIISAVFVVIVVVVNLIVVLVMIKDQAWLLTMP